MFTIKQVSAVLAQRFFVVSSDQWRPRVLEFFNRISRFNSITVLTGHENTIKICITKSLHILRSNSVIVYFFENDFSLKALTLSVFITLLSL